MPHCTKCGAAVADNAGFCPSCGSPVTAAPAAGAAPGALPPATSAQSGLTPNVAAMLSYLVGWVTGLIFFLIDKRPDVQFHARQSITLFGGLSLISLVLLPVFGIGTMAGWGFFALVSWAINIIGFVFWVVCMIKAFQGQRFRVPLAADLSEKIFGKV